MKNEKIDLSAYTTLEQFENAGFEEVETEEVSLVIINAKLDYDCYHRSTHLTYDYVYKEVLKLQHEDGTQIEIIVTWSDEVREGKHDGLAKAYSHYVELNRENYIDHDTAYDTKVDYLEDLIQYKKACTEKAEERFFEDSHYDQQFPSSITIKNNSEENKMNEFRFEIRVAENGDCLEGAASFDKALEVLKAFELEDEKEGQYKPDYYQVYDSETEEALY